MRASPMVLGDVCEGDSATVGPHLQGLLSSSLPLQPLTSPLPVSWWSSRQQQGLHFCLLCSQP